MSSCSACVPVKGRASLDTSNLLKSSFDRSSLLKSNDGKVGMEVAMGGSFSSG